MPYVRRSRQVVRRRPATRISRRRIAVRPRYRRAVVRRYRTTRRR